MSEDYSVIYNGENLYSCNMTLQEKARVEDLRQELIDICDNLKVPREKCFDGSEYLGRLQDNYDFEIKYKEGIGYFALSGERGKFSMVNGFPTMDKEEAKFILLEMEFSKGGFRHELNLRDALKKEWTGKYGVEYDSRKAAFEYAIRMLREVFNGLPEGTIDKYTEYMNRWFESEHWYFDKSRLSFEEHY